MRKDYKSMLEVKKNSLALQRADASLKSDRDFMLAMVKEDAWH
jgi:hypothetical protein